MQAGKSSQASEAAVMHPRQQPLKRQRQRSCAGYTSSGGAGAARNAFHAKGDNDGSDDTGSGDDGSTELQLAAERLALGQARLEGEAAARSWAKEVQQLQEQVCGTGGEGGEGMYLILPILKVRQQHTLLVQRGGTTAGVGLGLG
jgi:hypothetical protein